MCAPAKPFLMGQKLDLIFEYQTCRNCWLPSGVSMGNPEPCCSLSIPLPVTSITLPRKSSFQLHPTALSFSGKGMSQQGCPWEVQMCPRNPLLPIILPSRDAAGAPLPGFGCATPTLLIASTETPAPSDSSDNLQQERIYLGLGNKMGELLVTRSPVMPWFVYRDSPASQIPHSRHQGQFELQKGVKEVGQKKKNTLWVCAKP